MKHSGPYQPRLVHEQPIWYQPASGTTIAGRGIGPDWAGDGVGVVSHPTPANTFLNQFRRTRITSTAAADNELGIHLPNAADLSIWRGDATSRGGFWFSARFIVSALPGTAVRFFAGLSAANVGQCQANNFTAAGVGLWCDTGDAGSLTIGSAAGAGAPSKTALSTARTLATGILYEFVMIGIPAGSTIVTQLWDVGAGTKLAAQNVSATLPGTAVFLGPQVGLSNAAAGVGYSLDIISVYARPNHFLDPAQAY